MAEQFEKHARTFGILTLVSRMTGLVRDAALASVFGISSYTDAFNFAFQIPNLFRRLFGEGAISAAFVPRYTRLVRDDPERARRYAGLLMGLLAGFLWLLVVIGEVLIFMLWRDAPEIQYSIGPSTSVGGVLLPTVSLRYARLAYEPGGDHASVHAAGVLGRSGRISLANPRSLRAHRGQPDPAEHSHDRSDARALSAGARGLARHGNSFARAGVCRAFAGFLQVAWTMGALRSVRPVFAPRDATAWASVRATLLGAGPMMLGLGVLQINIVVDGIIATGRASSAQRFSACLIHWPKAP